MKNPFVRRPAVALTALATAAAVAAGVVVAVATQHSAGQPAVHDAATVVGVADAHAVAARYGHRVQVASLDAAESTTYANPDGTETAELSTTPVRVRQGGGWAAPDSTLAAAKNGTLSPRAASSPVVLGAAGSRDVLTVPMGAGSVVYTWPTPLPKPAFSGSVATYAEVAPGIDLRVDVGVEASHVSAVIKRRPTTPLRSVDLGLRLTGLTASQDAGGSLTYKDAAGKVAGTSSTPLAWDSTVVPHLGGALRIPLSSRLQRVGSWTASPPAGGQKQTRLAVQHLALPAGWLDSPSTKYPVTVDPASPAEANWTYVDSAYPTASYTQNTDPTDENGGHVHVGLSPGPGGQVTRGLFRFASANLVGRSIVTAKLATTGVWSWNCTPTGSTIA